MLIKQCNISPPLKRNKKGYNFLKYYNLNEYNNPKMPAIFYGLFDRISDIRKLRDHKSLAIIMWLGSDILQKRQVQIVKKMPNVKHIAISSFIASDLKKHGLKYKFFPIRGIPFNDIKPNKLGKGIYTYTPSPSNKKYRQRYGYDILKNVIKKCPFKINIVTSPNQYSRKKILKIYSSCFCGLRFTKHDGLSNTVIDLGLMGRKCFSNDKNLPNAVKWDENDIDGIIKNIMVLSKNIGKIDRKTASRVLKYISIGNSWLKTDTWKRD